MFTEFDCPEDGLCSNQGNCDDTIGSCICNEGFEGNTCKGEKDNQLSNVIYVNYILYFWYNLPYVYYL